MRIEKNNPNAVWHKWPDEVPDLAGRQIHSYFVKGYGGLDGKLHSWVCQYVQADGLKGWYLNGNEFTQMYEKGRTFDWIDVDELYPVSEEVKEEVKEEVPEFFAFCKDYILENIEEYEGNDVYACDFGITMTEGMCCDGTFTYSTAEAHRYLNEWFLEAGEFLEYEKMNFGERSNPFDNVEAFTVRMVSEGVRTILSRCQFIDDMWNKKFELTPEIIATIKEQVEEQTNDELF